MKIDKPTKSVTKEELNRMIREDLEYLKENFPRQFNRKLIDQNIETVLDTTLDLFNIREDDYAKVDSAWRWASVFYLENLIVNFKLAKKGAEREGFVFRIGELDYDTIRDTVFNFYKEMGLI